MPSSATTLHPQLHHAGWIGTWTGKRHYFMPGMNTSECGMFFAEDSSPRDPADPGVAGCNNCRKVVARFALKLRALNSLGKLGDEE